MRLSKPAKWLVRLWLAVGVLAGGGVAALLIAGPPATPEAAAPPKPPAPEPLAPTPPARDHGDAAASNPKTANPETARSEAARPEAGKPEAGPPAHADAVAPEGDAVVMGRPDKTGPDKAVAERTVGGAPDAPKPGRDMPGPIADPDPALLDPQGAGQAVPLPRIAPDGRTPMAVYASASDRTNTRPRVAILLGGVGLSETESEAALKSLPAAVSVAVSPYMLRPERLLGTARLTRHEILLSVPMEPLGYPTNDAGERSLKTTLPAEENRARLTWSMTRFAGYAGLTNALGQLRGERFAGSVTAMQPVLSTLSQRGLFWLDARAGSGTQPGVWSRGVDVVVDDASSPAEADARLAQLELVARDRGSAVGLVMLPRPGMVARLAAWSQAAAERGIALVPVSAVMRAPDPDTRAAK